jgi:hypothetical protein
VKNETNVLLILVEHAVEDPAENGQSPHDLCDLLHPTRIRRCAGRAEQAAQRARRAHAHREATRAKVVAIRRPQHPVRERLGHGAVANLRADLYERTRELRPVVRDEADDLPDDVEDADRRATGLMNKTLAYTGVTRRRDADHRNVECVQETEPVAHLQPGSRHCDMVASSERLVEAWRHLWKCNHGG